MRRVILNIHLAIGLTAGLIVVVLGATGAILAFEPELDRMSHRQTSYVKPGDRSLSLVEIGNAISLRYPGESIIAYLPSSAPDFSMHVILSRGIVSVNPYTGQVLGLRTRGQSFLGIVRALHVRLAKGEIGRAIVKWSTFATLLSVISGLYLWWPVKRMRIVGRLRSARFWYDLHSSVGFFSLLPVVVLAATGMVIGFEDQAKWFIDNVTSARAINNRESVAAPVLKLERNQISPDQAVTLASAQMPGAVISRVQMPQFGGSYVVALNDRQNRFTGEQNFISLDPSSGRIISVRLSSSLSSGQRFMALNDAIHTGNIWGMATKTVALVTSLVLPLQAVSGLLIWLRRKGFSQYQVVRRLR